MAPGRPADHGSGKLGMYLHLEDLSNCNIRQDLPVPMQFISFTSRCTCVANETGV